MGKAINWSEEFYSEVINEDCETCKIALRPGTLYYDNGYYVKNEIVDIRVNHKFIRKAEIIENMKILKIKDLSNEFLLFYKKDLRRKPDIIDFLANYYKKPVNMDTIVTIITYKNLPVELADGQDDPHF